MGHLQRLQYGGSKPDTMLAQSGWSGTPQRQHRTPTPIGASLPLSMQVQSRNTNPRFMSASVSVLLSSAIRRFGIHSTGNGTTLSQSGLFGTSHAVFPALNDRYLCFQPGIGRKKANHFWKNARMYQDSGWRLSVGTGLSAFTSECK